MVGVPLVLWNPKIETGDGVFGPHQDGFAFKVTGTPDIPIVVEGNAVLSSGNWVPLLTNKLSGGSIHFSDPSWTQYSGQIYRIRSP